MSDVAMAHSYVADIGGRGRVKEIIGRAYDALARQFPHEEEPANRWTERRVRSFWAKEAAGVQFREMMELHETAQAVKAERELLRKAKAEHAEFIARTARLEAMLQSSDPSFHCDQIEALGGELGRMDRTRTEGRS